jgi:mannose-6-phosphate isomerase-like protein (cupin superfamily)
MKKINLADEFASISKHWSPVVVADLNGQQVKLVKLAGEFAWHKHKHEDELFLVVKGEMRIDLPDGFIDLSEGEFFVVPMGVNHRTAAAAEAQVLLFEPRSTAPTGDA